MSRIHKFETPKEIKTMVDTAFEVNSISQSQIYRISALVKARKDSLDKRSTNGRRKVRTDDFIEADRRVTMEELAIKFETSINTIFHVLHDDLGLSIKSARWIPKMLTEDHKMKRVRCAQAFLKLNFELGLGFLDKIVTMDETSVVISMAPEGLQPAPEVQASRIKEETDGSQLLRQLRRDLPAISPERTSVTAAVFKDVMNIDLYFRFDNAPCNTANSTKEFLAKKGIKVIDHPPYSPDLAPADFFYFPIMKKMLEGVEIVDKSIQKEWTRVERAILEERFREGFRKWVERWEKCIRIGGSHVEKIC
ncbi:Mariner transposase [Caligus rogercresseyi]|uniref:Mariner transposase n=1 Tax=Caligus rogercresseyi TaxID=217165 RepID=A0A7T8K8D3_CALRO|nr:Mariner transposase [Caligus rogercresseyi]